MRRCPKLGEQWTTPNGRPFTCIDDDPDGYDAYGWVYEHLGTRTKCYSPTDGLTPPKAEPPEWLKGAPWVLVSGPAERWTSGGWDTPGDARSGSPSPLWLGCINVLTGEWVPRD